VDWIERLNQAVGYIEKNLEGEIDYNEISRITVSPMALFQRFFVLATGTTLSEYIRRRKLTRALIDLQNTDEKVIDIAFKYGYESSNAFCTAFKRLYDITPSKAKIAGENLKHYNRVYFTLTITYVKGENEMILLNIDSYRYYDPLFEGARIVLAYMGEKYSPEYILGLSGSVFKIAGGCPSRPTCVCDFWPADFLRFIGYEVEEYPCVDSEGNDISDKMIESVRKSIDEGKPVLVWHAFTLEEWDVVCGYDDEAKHFIGRGTHKGNDDYAREQWGHAKTSNVHAFGAVAAVRKIAELNQREAEIRSLVSAVKHARTKSDERNDGIEFYYKWADEYSREGRDKGVADEYCYIVYSSVRKAAVKYLREIAYKFGGGALENMQYAANCFEKESAELDKAWPYLGVGSAWGVDEERSQSLAPILKAAAEHYEKGIEYIEKALQSLHIEY